MPPAKSTLQSDDRKHLDGIDLLRGLAIFFVLMNHINIRLLGADVLYTKYLYPQLVHLLVWNAQPGVQMFFAVSGFLITSISLRRWGSLSNISLRDFYLLRFARIAPLLFLLLAILSSLHFANVHHFVVTAETGGLGRALFAAITFHVNVLEARHGYLPANWDVLWSLSVEEMFYLFFPLVCRVFGRSKLFLAILLSFVALGPFGRTVFAQGNEIWEEYSYLGGMEGIACGCLTAVIVSRTRFTRPVLWFLGGSGAAIVIASLVFSWQAYRGWPGRTGLNMTILVLGTCMFIAACAQTQWKAPRFLPAAKNRAVQLRGLSHAHVRCVCAIRPVPPCRPSHAPRTRLIRLHHPHCRGARCLGRDPLFRADESIPAQSLERPSKTRPGGRCRNRGFKRNLSEVRATLAPNKAFPSPAGYNFWLVCRSRVMRWWRM